MSALDMAIDALLELPAYAMPQEEKEARLVPVLAALCAHHRVGCPAYRRLGDVHGWREVPRQLGEVPWLPAALWKSHRLTSVPDAELVTTMTSSGTTGGVPSRVYLDAATARRQSKALARILCTVLGPRRQPMLVIDTASALRDRTTLSARAAGILGVMTFGTRPVFALRDDLSLDRNAVEGFLLRHGNAPFMVFGFTYMVWRYLHQCVDGVGLDLSHGVLLHSGGWKRLGALAVDNATFRRELARSTGLVRSYNFYGSVEQVGSVLLEGADGALYAPPFADVLVRDPVTLEEVPEGTQGVLQIMSALPTSYPGHSILTEDLAVVERVDRGGRLGKAIRVLGRVPRSEVRGCGDTFAM